MKTIIVTGASQGIGKATALKFLAEGWTVGLLARRAEPLAELAAEHPNAVPLACDVTDEASVDAAFASLRRPRPAGSTRSSTTPAAARRRRPSTRSTPTLWRAVVEVNLNGMFLVRPRRVPADAAPDRRRAAGSSTTARFPR